MRIATAGVRTGFAMTPFTRGAVGRATARVAPTEGGGVKFSEFLGCCTGEGNGGGNGEGGEGIGENYKEV